MPALTPALLAPLESNFRSLTLESLELHAAKRLLDDFAMEVNSNKKKEIYGWLLKLPSIRRWIGDRHIYRLESAGWEISNEAFESTVSVDREDIEDDSIGLYRPPFQLLGQRAAVHRDKLMADLIVNGITALCHDGQYFFDTDHPVGTSTKTNKHTLALTDDNFATVYSTMMALTDDAGEPLDVMPNVLFCAPQLFKKASDIAKAERTASGATNSLQGLVTVRPLPRLAATPTRWGLVDTTKVIKPFIFQTRKNFEFVAHDDPAVHANAFNRKELVYGIDGRFGAGYGLWQLAAIADSAF